jgi:hypothetical protein
MGRLIQMKIAQAVKKYAKIGVLGLGLLYAGCASVSQVKPRTGDYVKVRIEKVFDKYEANIEARDKDGLDKIVLTGINMELYQKVLQCGGRRYFSYSVDFERTGTVPTIIATSFDLKGNREIGGDQYVAVGEIKW